MNNDIFIEFGSFLVNKKDILLAQKNYEELTIELTLKYEDTRRTISMKFSSQYSLDDAMLKLSSGIKTMTLDRWENPLIRQIIFQRGCINELCDLMKKQTVKIETLSKLIKSTKNKQTKSSKGEKNEI